MIVNLYESETPLVKGLSVKVNKYGKIDIEMKSMIVKIIVLLLLKLNIDHM